MVGDGIKVTVVEIRGEKVRLGFECDKGVPVHRQEVWEAIKRGDPPKIPQEVTQPNSALSSEAV
jgi:carbon storage regulator